MSWYRHDQQALESRLHSCGTLQTVWSQPDPEQDESMPAADLKHCVLQRRVVAQKDMSSLTRGTPQSASMCVHVHKIKISTNSMCIIIIIMGKILRLGVW